MAAHEILLRREEKPIHISDEHGSYPVFMDSPMPEDYVLKATRMTWDEIKHTSYPSRLWRQELSVDVIGMASTL